MIAVIAAGIGFIVVVAIVVGIVDAMQAARWRQIAAERRARWEERQLQLHGPMVGQDSYDTDPWYDD